MEIHDQEKDLHRDQVIGLLSDIVGYSDSPELPESLCKMSPREKDFRTFATIILYYGLAGHRPHTFKQIGTRFGITKEMIRHNMYLALQKIRESDRSGELKLLLTALASEPKAPYSGQAASATCRPGRP